MNSNAARRRRVQAIAPIARRSTLLAAGSGLLVPFGRARAQGVFPTHPVRIIVPATPGGAIDITSRLLAERLSPRWKQPVVVENRPGANNIIGTEMVARSAPDGHTLGVSAVTHAINVALYKTPFDTLRDFVTVTVAYTVPLILVASPDFRASNVRELIALAKAEPERITFAGTGGAVHLAGEMFALQAGAKMTHVPYRGSSAAHPDLMSGRVDIMFDTLPAVLGYIRDGKLKALATGASTRTALLPDLPTVSESGLPGYEATSWGIFFGPAGIPDAVLQQINADMVAALKESAVREKMGSLGAEVVGSDVAAAQAFVQSEVAKWSEVAAKIGLEKQ